MLNIVDRGLRVALGIGDDAIGQVFGRQPGVGPMADDRNVDVRKISVGVRRMPNTPNSTISIARTIKV